VGDQPYIMSQLRKFPRPVVRAAASFHANQTGLETSKERQQLCPPLRLVEGDLFASGDRFNLKNALGQIKADCGSLHGALFSKAKYRHLQYGALRRRVT